MDVEVRMGGSDLVPGYLRSALTPPQSDLPVAGFFVVLQFFLRFSLFFCLRRSLFSDI